jgi:hypothetical protein
MHLVEPLFKGSEELRVAVHDEDFVHDALFVGLKGWWAGPCAEAVAASGAWGLQSGWEDNMLKPYGIISLRGQ